MAEHTHEIVDNQVPKIHSNINDCTAGDMLAEISQRDLLAAALYANRQANALKKSLLGAENNHLLAMEPQKRGKVDADAYLPNIKKLNQDFDVGASLAKVSKELGSKGNPQAFIDEFLKKHKLARNTDGNYEFKGTHEELIQSVSNGKMLIPSVIPVNGCDVKTQAR